MYSPSQRTAQITANPNWSNKSKRRRRARPSILGFGEDSHDEKLPSTPLSRTAAHPQHVDAFSPFSYRSSNDSPRPGHVSSPSVILFSGPDDRGFERVHDDSFPRDLALLKSMARSKFKLASAAPVEMSYVNPDGIVCDLDDEHDLRALAVHANLAPKLRVRVTSSAHSQEAVLSQSEAAAQQPHASTNGTGGAHSNGKPEVAPALVGASQNDTPSKFAVAAAVPGDSASSRANGHSANGATPAKSRRKSSAKAGPPATTSMSSHITDGRRSDEPGTAVTTTSSLVADSASERQSVTPAAKKTSAKRKRTDISPPPSASSSAAIPAASPTGPVAKKPRGRPKKSLASETIPADFQLTVAEPQNGSTPTLSTSQDLAPAADAPATLKDAKHAGAVQEEASVEAPKRARANKRVAAAPSQASEQEQTTADTPKRGRPRKSVPTTSLPSTQDTAAGQEGGAFETPKRGRTKKAPASAVAVPSQPDITPAGAPTNDTETATVMATTEISHADGASQLDESVAVDQPQRSETSIPDSIPVPNLTPAGKPRGRPSKKAIAEAEAAAALKASQELRPVTTPGAATEEQPSQISQAAVAPEKSAPASRVAKATTSNVVESVQDKQPDTPISLDVGSAVVEAATDPLSQAPSASEAAPLPLKKKVGRPKAAKAIKEAGAKPDSTPASRNDPQSTPDATTETTLRSSSDAPLTAVPAVAKKKLGRPTNAARAAKAAEAAEAAAKSAKAKEAAVASEPVAVSQPSMVAAPIVEEQAPTPSEAASNAVDQVISSQSVEDATVISEAAAKDATEVELPSRSVLSAPDSTPADACAASPSAATKRATAAKARASKASGNTAAAEPATAIDACIACGATPSHDRERCPIWQGGSQSILDLLAMVRKRKPKSQKDKELTRLLTDWLAKQFGAPEIDFTASQELTKPSQELAASAGKDQSANAAANGAVSQADSTQATAAEPSDVVTTASQSKQAPLQSTATKRSTAKAAVLARSTPEPELPPPSGIEASSNDAAAPLPVPASPAKSGAREARSGQSKTATAAAKAKPAKKSAAEPTSEPKIALTPSSPPHPESSQSPDVPGTGLRAPSESSEAELATSPMLSAVPRANGDMDVDEMPPQTPSQPNTSQPNTAAQQLEERKRKMKLADQAVPAAAAAAAVADVERASSPETVSTPRSRSASITSSDSSGDGRSSGDESDARSDADAGKKGRRGAAKQPKSTSTKASRSRASPAKASRAAAKETASSSDSDTSSSDSETDPEAEPSKKSTPSTKNGAAAGPKAKTPSTSRSAQRLAAPDNPFLRGLTPLSSRRSNGTGSTSQKSTPFTRLSELKPGIFRQNMSQPGSPLSTGGSTPLSGSSQTPFFASQPLANGNGNESGSAPDTPAVSAAATPEAATPTIASDAEDDDEVSSSSSSSSSSEDEAPRSRGRATSATKGGGSGSMAAKRAGKRGKGVAAAKPAAAKKRKSMFDVFA